MGVEAGLVGHGHSCGVLYAHSSMAIGSMPSGVVFSCLSGRRAHLLHTHHLSACEALGRRGWRLLPHRVSCPILPGHFRPSNSCLLLHAPCCFPSHSTALKKWHSGQGPKPGRGNTAPSYLTHSNKTKTWENHNCTPATFYASLSFLALDTFLLLLLQW